MYTYSEETADRLILYNNAFAYIGRIAIAIFFLAPLGQGDFSAFKQRAYEWGPPVIIAAFMGLVDTAAGFVSRGLCALIVHIAGLGDDHLLANDGPDYVKTALLLPVWGWMILTLWRVHRAAGP